MDNYDPDLILDLAAGILPGDEARAAEASLSAEGRAELEAQRAVMAAIADAPPVGMTDLERAHLHRSVASEIATTTHEQSPTREAAPAPPRRRRSVVWMKWASAATAAAMFVGVVAVGTQLGGGSDSDTAAETIRPPSDALTDETAGFLAGRSSSDGGLSPLSSTTSPLITTNGATGGDAGDFGDSAAESGSGFFLEEAPQDSDLEALTDYVTEAIDARRVPVAGVNTLSCYEVAAEDDDLDVVSGFLLSYPGPDGGELSAIAFSGPGTDPLIRIYDLASCEPLAVNE